jgi:hypothetical protein
MPIRSIEDVDDEDSKGLLCLAQLPVLKPAGAFQIVAAMPDLVRQRLVRGLAREELPYPTYEVGGGGLADQLAPQEELGTLLQ